MKTLFLLFLFLIGAHAYAKEVPLSQLEKELQIQCANLIYGGTQTSVCFADKFLTTAAKETQLRIAPHFSPVQLASPALFQTPFAVWSGEGNFSLSPKERENLKHFLNTGGFIVASPGCSNADWDKAFRNELKIIFPENSLQRIPMEHPIFSTVYKIDRLTLKSGGSTTQVEGLLVDGRLVLVYSREGLNDVKNAKGCCCCGGNQINEGEKVNVNLLIHALLY